MDGLSIRCQESGGCVVVSLAGELDVATAPLLRSQIDTLVAGGCARLVLDLGALEFVDASGLGVLVYARCLAVRHDGWVRLARACPMARRILRVACLTQVLPVFASVTEALSAKPEVTGGGDGVAPRAR